MSLHKKLQEVELLPSSSFDGEDAPGSLERTASIAKLKQNQTSGGQITNVPRLMQKVAESDIHRVRTITNHGKSSSEFYPNRK